MENNKRLEKVINDINKELSKLLFVKYQGSYAFDYSDIGNIIGIIIEENKTEEDNRYTFESGLQHGYSLIDGTH